MKTIQLRRPDDMHLHLRQGDLLKSVLPYTVEQCARALVMPNILPPVLKASDLNSYRDEIKRLLNGADQFEPLMTFKVSPGTEVEEIPKLKEAGAVAGKLYPEGVTTNSADGVRDFEEIYPIYEAMQKEDLVLCIHGEAPSASSMDRESQFLSTFKQIAKDFPKLRIVLEHVSTKEAVDCVSAMPNNIAATITVHHLFLTIDDVIGGKLNPHLFCKPIAKLPEDRVALRKAAMSGDPKFFFGSDSAPHTVENKECSCGAAGVYTAPVLMPALCQLFDEYGSLDKLESFVSEYGANFYRLPLNTDTIKLRQESWQVPETYGDVKPFLAGTDLAWKLDLN